jgi:hypothetical protein
MKNRTFRAIVILVGSLFLNIEAAQAGLVHKMRVFIRQEFPDTQLWYVAAALLVIGFLCYVIFAPVFIGKEKWAWLNYYSYQPPRHGYKSKRVTIKKISGMLNNAEISTEAGSRRVRA